MIYDFIAEFFRDTNDASATYRTHLRGIHDAESLIKRIGMVEDPESTSGLIDYLKEMHQCELTELFTLKENPELADIIFEGDGCRRIVLHAYELEAEPEIRCSFGVEDAIWATFSGNRADSRVRITSMYQKPVIDLPLRCFKEKMGVLTLFEVMQRLEKEYSHIVDEDLNNLRREFESGLKRAIDIVSHEFADDPDLDGNPQLLHMTAVSSAGKNDDERLVGLLHDLVEDKDWTFDDLLRDGFPKHIVDTLRLLTHDKEIPYMDYVRNICESGDRVALAVKINDLNHNLKRGRAGGHWHHVAKHEKALAFIQEFIEKQMKDEQ